MSGMSASGENLRAVTYDLRPRGGDGLRDDRGDFKDALWLFGIPLYPGLLHRNPKGVTVSRMGDSTPLAWGYGFRRGGNPGSFVIVSAGVRQPDAVLTPNLVVNEEALLGAVYLALTSNLPNEMMVKDRMRIYPEAGKLAVAAFREGLPKAFPGFDGVTVNHPPYRPL